MFASGKSVVVPARTSRQPAQTCVPLAAHLKLAVSRRVLNVQASAGSDALSESVGADITGTAASMDGPVVEAKVPWFKKPCAFKEVESVEDLMAAVAPENNGGRMSVVDFYAGWCACCKSSFPALCRIPTSDVLSKNFNFYKANIEEGDFAAFIKKKGVRGIPHVLVINSDGTDLIGMGASFKKMEVLRKNLDFIARAEKRDFVLDPNGIIMSR